MIMFTRLADGRVRVTYPAHIESNGQQLNVIPPDQHTEQLVSDTVRIFNILLPFEQKLSAYQVSQLIESHSDDPSSIAMAEQLKNLRLNCILTA